MKNLIKKIFISIIFIFLLLLLIYNIVLISAALLFPNKTPSIFGIKTYVIVSGSMKPELNIGDIVVVKEVKSDDLNVGDIISYRIGQNIITHRIADIYSLDEEIYYVTKGDNNNTRDKNDITIDFIEGKVINKIEKIGNIILLLRNKYSIIVISIIFFFYFLYKKK